MAHGEKLSINHHPVNLRGELQKFLGLYIDENFSWKYHISHVTMKMSKMTGILGKTRPYLPLKLTLQMLYMTMIYPYLNECYFTEVMPLNNI